MLFFNMYINITFASNRYDKHTFSYEKLWFFMTGNILITKILDVLSYRENTDSNLTASFENYFTEANVNSCYAKFV